MKIFLTLFSVAFSMNMVMAQALYFPPLTGDEWATVSPKELKWCEESIEDLYQLLEEGNTKAFIVLKDGKIALEKYFDDHDKDKYWYWASAGKTITSVAIGMLESHGRLSLDDKTSDYLGTGWTSLSQQQEDQITIRHQLTMTSGLDDTTGDPYCTDPSCLVYKADPGERWAYHNAPYTLLDDVVESASGQSLNAFLDEYLEAKTGIRGLFLKSGYNNVYSSTARSMARFGLLMLNDGVWDGEVVLDNPTFVHDMRSPSQDLNPSYGYLWWLNGQSGYMLPGLQFRFNGSWCGSCENDLYAGLGKNGQFVDIIPSRNIVVIRMGNAPDLSLVPIQFHEDMWQLLSRVMCIETATDDWYDEDSSAVYPNPSTDIIYLTNDSGIGTVYCYNMVGQRFDLKRSADGVSIEHLAAGTYTVHYLTKDQYLSRVTFVKAL